ncbi:MAG: methyltransferase domain-containing protein [Ignavibacteriales bacterium]|nr:methyltransferase domain-containing protein [Ignavibacteriales bacterium]
MDQGVVKESIRSHWEKFWRERPEVDEVYSNADRILRNLEQVVDVRGKRVLEIGAGTGRDSFPIAQRGGDVVQLDYAESSLRILKHLSAENGLSTTIVCGDTFRLPFRDETFDVVFHQGLLEHFRVDFARDLLRENIRVLKKGGHLLVDVPQRYHLYTIAKHALIALNKWFAGWERSFSLRELRREMKNLGLTPVYAYGEWMVPSFLYRVVREIIKKAGVTLPLYPAPVPVLTRLRDRLRYALHKTKLQFISGISIGVVGRKD